MYVLAEKGSKTKDGPQSGIIQSKQKAGAGAKPIEDNRVQNHFWQRANNTGLPDNLKSGVETLSGQSLDDVQVHYNSDKPAQFKAYAYAQGNNIHLGPGQERHLPHEAWHVAQQKSGIVQPTTQLKGGEPVNTDPDLEREADTMGHKALQVGSKPPALRRPRTHGIAPNSAPMQMLFWVHNGQVQRPETIRARVDEYGADDEVYRILVAWSNDQVVAGRRFWDWAEAIQAAKDAKGPSLGRKLFILALILLIVFGGMWWLFGIPSFGNQRAHENPEPLPEPLPQPHYEPVLPPRDLPTLQGLRNNSNLLALRGLRPGNISLEEIEDLPDGGQALHHLDPYVEELGPDLLAEQDEIERAATSGPVATHSGEATTHSGEATTHSGEATTHPLPSEVDLSEDPVERTEQIRELNSDYLSRNVDVIKVVTHARAGQLGRGHPSAGVSAVEQLIRDYAGKVRIELVIMAEPSAMFIFSHLLEGLDISKDRQELSYRNHNFTVIRQDPLPTDVQLISPIDGGGQTKMLRSGQKYNVSLHADDELEMVGNDGITDVNRNQALMHAVGTQKLIALKPHQWHSGRRFIDTGDLSYPITESPSSIYKGGTYKDKAPGMLSPINEVIRENIQRVVMLARAGKIDLWTTYGFHYTEATEGSGMKHPNEISSLMVISAFHYQTSTGGKPVVIINLSKLNPTHTQNIRGYEGQNFNGNTIDYDKITEPSVLSVLVNGGVTFIDMLGGIPKDWFSLLVDSATLPIAYEGANTANLAHQMGKNFMSMRTHGSTRYIKMEGFEEGYERLEEASDALASRFAKSNATIVAQVLIELKDPHSAVAQYVAEVLKKAKKPESDQALMAINKLRYTK